MLPLFNKQYKPHKTAFNLHLVEEDQENFTFLNMKDKSAKLIKPAFKVIQNFDIRVVDFTNVGFHDESIRVLANYISQNPNLRSIVLNQNLFSDDGLSKLAHELKFNTRLVHISFKECKNVTDRGLKDLCDVLSNTNTVLFQVELDIAQFNEELALTVIRESALNRDI